MTSTHSEPSISGSKCAAISSHVVRTMSAYTGRGPTKGRTHINDDVVTVVLQCTLTKGEKSLVRDGLDGLVLTMRKAFHGTTADADAEQRGDGARGIAKTPTEAMAGADLGPGSRT